MFKIAGMVCLIAGSIGLSLDKVNEDILKMQHLKNIQGFTAFLIGEISHTRIPIPDICEEYLDKAEGTLKIVLDRITVKFYNENGKSFQSIWQETVQEISASDKTYQEAKMQLLKLSKCFGYSNVKLQTAFIEQFDKQLEMEIVQKEKRFQDNKKLIICLGIMSGLFLSILLL